MPASAKRPQFGPLVIDSALREAWLREHQIELTGAEFDLLWLLTSNPGASSREEIFAQLRGIEYDGRDRSIDVRISRIRPKIGDDPDHPRLIKTVRGKGYLFVSKRLRRWCSAVLHEFDLPAHLRRHARRAGAGRAARCRRAASAQPVPRRRSPRAPASGTFRLMAHNMSSMTPVERRRRQPLGRLLGIPLRVRTLDDVSPDSRLEARLLRGQVLVEQIRPRSTTVFSPSAPAIGWCSPARSSS